MSEHDILPQSPLPSAPPMPGRQWSPRQVRLAGYAVGVLLAVGVAALGFWLTTAWRGDPPAADTTEPAKATGPVSWERTAVSDDGLADRSGVRIVQVAVTGGGGLIDLRFQVIDPDKAYTVHDAATPPALVDEATGLVVNQLLMGHSPHTRDFKAGQTYYLVFENPGNLVQRGSVVSVLLGDAQVEHVTVQ